MTTLHEQPRPASMDWPQLEAVLLAAPMELWSRNQRAGISGEDGERMAREGVMIYLQRLFACEKCGK